MYNIDMKKILALVAVFVILLSAAEIKAQEKKVSFGIRAGANLSGQCVNFSEIYSDTYESNVSWKVGFLAGAVLDLKVGKGFVVQPGVFAKYQAYDYLSTSIKNLGGYMRILKGDANYYTFQIPLLVSYRVNMSSLEWQIDAGPYVAFGVGGNNNIESTELILGDTGSSTKTYKYKHGFYDKSDGVVVGNETFDCGLKLGTGLNIKSKYYVGVHYNLGLINAGKNHDGFKSAPRVKNHSVDFSIGYNF